MKHINNKQTNNEQSSDLDINMYDQIKVEFVYKNGIKICLCKGTH